MIRRIRKTFLIFGAVVIALLLVSTVTAVQQTQSIPYNEQKEKIEELTSKLEQFTESPAWKRLGRIAERNIEENERKEMREKIHSIIQEHFHYPLDIPDWVDEILQLLSDICCSIVEVFLLLFGHNPISLGLGIITMTIIMIIPIFLFVLVCYAADIINSPFYVFEVIEEVIDVDKVLHDYGLVGLATVISLFLVSWVVYIAIFTIVGLPLITLVVMNRIINDILDVYAWSQ